MSAPTKAKLHGERYLRPRGERLARFITEQLHYLDFNETMLWYAKVVPTLSKEERALLGCNDRFYLLTAILHRKDALHPWLFNRCREVEADPDGYLDLWARYHYKSTICTHAGIIQEICRDPEITVCILSATNAIAKPFLAAIQQELEANVDLKTIYDDVFWIHPRRQSPRWSRADGIIVKRRGNPKEATVEAWGLVDGMPIGKHYQLLDFDDLVTDKLVGNPEMIQKVTEKWELADNLGTMGVTRKWHQGTRYSFGDTYGIVLERKTLKPRIYAATDDGTITGKPVMLTPEKWADIIDTQRSTVNAQMLLNPVAGKAQIFKPEMMKGYEVRPTILNVFMMGDPSKGSNKKSDRTAIAVVGIDVNGSRYLLDGVRHRMTLSERWDHLKRLHKRWSEAIGVQNVKVGYERYGKDVEIEVLQERMERDGYSFAIEELNWPRQGLHSKKDRIERLEPDMRKGRFNLPRLVYHPELRGRGNLRGKDGWAIWSVKDGKIDYTPYIDMTKAQRTCQQTGQGYRIVKPITARDEDGNPYDLTRAFIEEALFFPFAPKDDLIDAVSRLYDMGPRPAVQHESKNAETPAYEDS